MRNLYNIDRNYLPKNIENEIEVEIAYSNNKNIEIDFLKIDNVLIREMAFTFFYYHKKNNINVYYFTIKSFYLFVNYCNSYIDVNKSLMEYYYQSLLFDFCDKTTEVYKKKTYFIGSFYVFWECYLKEINQKPEYEYDVWDINKLGIQINHSPIKNINRIDFSNIKSKYYREFSKKFVLNQLKVKCPTTITVKKHFLDYFFEYLYDKKKEPKIEDLDRDIIEDYISYIHSLNTSAKKARKFLDSLKTFLVYCCENGYTNKLLLNNYDKIRVERDKKPHPLSATEIKLIRDNLKYLNERYADMIYIALKLGLRPTDLSILKIDDLEVNGDSFFLNYYMPKVNRYNRLALDEMTKNILEKNICITKKEYEMNPIYIFQINDSPINFTNVITRLNHVFKKRNVLDGNGNIMHITAYRFRYTIATLMGNANFDESEIAMQLGHNNLKNITYYTKLFGSTIKKSIEPLLSIVDRLIELQNNTPSKIRFDTEKEMSIRIINGSCSAGINSNCKKGNACLTCALFRRESKETSLACINHEIELVKTDFEIAKKNSFINLNTFYVDLLKKLEYKKSIIEHEEIQV